MTATTTWTDTDLGQFAKATKRAARCLARLDRGAKDAVLLQIAQELESQEAHILRANAEDVAAGERKGLSTAMVDRLRLSPERLRQLATAVREVAALPDPVGEISRMERRPNGLQVGRQRVPLGVILMIYESRPNVTIEAASLCLKAGNGMILRGGSEAFATNSVLAGVIMQALSTCNLPAEAVQLVPTTDRGAMNHLLTLDDDIDLVIPRGGEGLIRFVSEHSRIPVIKHYKGVCHLYVDRDADLELALKLLVNGKTSRPGVCNALETLLVHEDVAETFLPMATQALHERGVVLRGCARTCGWVDVESADEADYHAEYLSLMLAVRVVDDYEAALTHIETYGSLHTEVIATDNYHAAQRFVRDVDASVVMVNASSRFSDGGELGLGAEIGISTTKLHAYGPMGLTALTTEKFVVFGEGQIR